MSSIRINEKNYKDIKKNHKDIRNHKDIKNHKDIENLKDINNHNRIKNHKDINNRKDIKRRKRNNSFRPAAALLAAVLLITVPTAAWGAGKIVFSDSTTQEAASGKDPQEPVLEPSVQKMEDLPPDPVDDWAREAAAGKKESGAPSSGEDEITVHLASDPGAPVPFEVMDMDTASLLKQISEGLVTLDENGEAVPGCAKKWSVSDHGLKWKFTLRRDLCWSDGESITAEDFENLFKKIADPSEEILYGQDLTKNIAGYEKVLEGDPDALEVSAEDDRTLVIRLSSPDSAFARKCASWTLLPIRELMAFNGDDHSTSEENAEDNSDRHSENDSEKESEKNESEKESKKESGNGSGNKEKDNRNKENSADSTDSAKNRKLSWDTVTGNGPYVIESCTPGQEYILTRNPYYRQDQYGQDRKDSSGSVTRTAAANVLQDNEFFSTVRWKVSGDVNKEYSDFLNGNIEAISQLPEETLSSEETAEYYSEQTVPDMLGMLFNCNHEALKDARVRQALSIVADRRHISTDILGGVYLPADDFTDLLKDPTASAVSSDDRSLLSAKESSADKKESLEKAAKLLREAGYKADLQDSEKTENAQKSQNAEKTKNAEKSDAHKNAEKAKKEKDFPVLTCMAQEDSTASEIAQYLAAEWNKLGIVVKVETADARHIAKAKEKGKYDILCGNLFIASDLPSTEFERFASESSENSCGYESKDFDKKLEKAQSASGEKSYTNRLQDAAGILTEETPASPLAMRTVSWLHDSSKADISCDAAGCWQIRKNQTGENQIQKSQIRENQVQEDQTQDKQIRENKETAERTEAADPEIEAEASVKTVMEGLEEQVRKQKGEKFAPGKLSYETGKSTWMTRLKQSTIYFDREDCTAYLTRQAYVLNAADRNADRLISLPKYSPVHLTGTGNAGYVRIEMDGIIRYMESDSVTTDTAAVKEIRAQEDLQADRGEFLAKPVHLVKESELSRRAEDVHEETDRILAEIAFQEMIRTQTRNPNWGGPVLSRSNGSVKGPNGRETYYNLNMNGVVNIMRRMGNTDEYWVRDDGCKMLGNYIMCAANLGVHPRGSLVESSLGTCIVCDTGGFARGNSQQLDIAVTW